MINILWIMLIIVLLIFSIIISKYINYENYNLIKILRQFKYKDRKGLFLSLGTKIGVGSIIGTTISIYIGGPGSVLWILIFSFFTSSLIYFESYYGNKYKEKNNTEYLSGPYFYIKNGLNKKVLAYITMAILILCYSIFFQMIQTNTIANILEINFNINKNIITIIFIIIIAFLLFFSLKELLNSMNKIVPIMSILYVVMGLICIINNISKIEYIFKLIISSAFTKKGILIGMVIGIKRAIFLNEIMIGTTSISSGVDNNSPKESAAIQTLGMYFITFIISLITSLLVLIFKEYNIIQFSNYNELISSVFYFYYGNTGLILLTIILFLFAITTIISGCYIGISNLTIITKNKKLIFIFKIFMLLFCIGGIYMNSDFVWKYVDILMYILILINIYSLYNLYKGDKL